MSDSEMDEYIAKVRQEVSEWPEWKKNLLADSVNPYWREGKNMSDNDKMQAEFEAWASVEGHSLRKYTQAEFEAFAKANGLDVLRWLDFSSSYIDSETTAAKHGYEAGYQAGQKAEREACAKACEDAAKGTKVELIGIGFAEMLRNRQEEK